MLHAALEPAALDHWLAAQPLPRLTARTTTDADSFRALLATVRADDFYLASEEHEAGVVALSVPLRNTWPGKRSRR